MFDFDTDLDGNLDGDVDFSAELNGAPVPVSVTNGGQSVSVTELVPAGWQLGSVTCEKIAGTNSQQTSTWDIPGTAADVEVDVAAGETVLCTFDNTENGTIIVDKSATAARPTDSFTFSSADVPGLPGDRAR
ncbi:MAG: hypothetical protein R2697_18565 [Ilumatobacteraceae bacterium]